MRKVLVFLCFLISGVAYGNDYHLDIMAAKGEPDKRLVIFTYRECVDVLKVSMKDIEQENGMDEKDLKAKGPITRWLISQKRLRDGQQNDCKK